MEGSEAVPPELVEPYQVRPAWQKALPRGPYPTLESLAADSLEGQQPQVAKVVARALHSGAYQRVAVGRRMDSSVVAAVLRLVTVRVGRGA